MVQCGAPWCGVVNCGVLREVCRKVLEEDIYKIIQIDAGIMTYDMICQLKKYINNFLMKMCF